MHTRTTSSELFSALTWSLLLLLALSLPFELKTPLFRAGPFPITNVEVVWYALLLVWGIHWLRTGSDRWTIAHTAVLVWAAVIVLSAAVAPSSRVAAWKFAFRSLAGCALFFAAADLVTTPARAAGLMIALAAGAAVSAAAAVAEVWAPAAQGVLSAFKTAPTRMGGFLRAGGTFQYPNTGAMYWEAVLPLVLATAAWYAMQRNSPVIRRVGIFTALLLTAAITLSASRAGIVTVICLCAILIAVPRTSVPGMKVPALVVVLGLTILATTASELLSLRMQSDDLATWYRAEYEPVLPLGAVAAGHRFPVTVTIRNTGLVTWRARGNHPFRLGYCWSDPTTRSESCSGEPPTRLPRDVPPRDEVTLVASVIAPPKPGAFVLHWDLEEKGVSWFRAYGGKPGDIPVQVDPAADRSVVVQHLREPSIPRVVPPGRVALWHAALRLWAQRPLLGVGPDNFRRRYGEVIGVAFHDDRLNAHNLFLETLATLGLLGVAALVSLVSSLVLTARNGWRATESVEHRVLGFGLLLGIGAFFVHGLVDHFLPFTPTCGLFWLLTGATVGFFRPLRQ